MLDPISNKLTGGSTASGGSFTSSPSGASNQPTTKEAPGWDVKSGDSWYLWVTIIIPKNP